MDMPLHAPSCEQSASKSPEKGVSVDACIERAKQLIDEYGICLFLIDIAGSKKALAR